MTSLLPLAADNANKVHLTAQTRIVAAVIALVFMLMIFELIRRDRLQERYAVIWLLAGLGMLAGAAAVQDTRRGLDLNVSEELALEALFYRLARTA